MKTNDIEHIRRCSNQSAPARRQGRGAVRAAELDQIRDHGLAGAGLSKAPKDKVAVADSLREQQTPSERRLGGALRGSKLPAFNAQVPLHGYVVDFYFANAMVAIEVDGAVHHARVTADRLRDDALAANGIMVLRFTNSRVDRDLGNVIAEIKKAVARRRNRAPQPAGVEDDWLLFRHGPDALRGSADGGYGVAASSATSRSRSAAQKTAGARRAMARPISTVKRKFTCLTCKRAFVDFPEPTPSCQRCGPQGKVRAVCRRCQGTVDRIFEDTWVCPRCTDARSAAITAAGSGETPTGPLRDRTSRARYLRPDGR